MDFMKLQYFLTVAQYRNFTRAAKVLYITQPTLSRQIAVLEEDIGGKLFDRSSRKVELTPLGKNLFDSTQTVLKQCQQLSLLAKKKVQFPLETIKLGYSGILEIDFLVASIRDMRKKYSGADIELHRNSLGKLTQRLLDKDLDIIFTLDSGLNLLSNIEFKRLFKTALMLVVPDDHPLASKNKILLNDVKDEPFVSLCREESFLTQDYIRRIFDKENIEPNIVEFCDNPQDLLITVGSGKGLALLATKYSNPEAYRVKYLDLEYKNNHIHTCLAIAWNKENLRQISKSYIDIILNYFEKTSLS